MAPALCIKNFSCPTWVCEQCKSFVMWPLLSMSCDGFSRRTDRTSQNIHPVYWSTSPVYILWIQPLQEGLHYCSLVFALLKFTPAHSSKQQSQLLSYWTELSPLVDLAALRSWLPPVLVETWWIWCGYLPTEIHTFRGEAGIYPWLCLTWTDEQNSIMVLINLSHVWAHSPV